MSGQCYGCGSGFSFMKKEHGCKNCGYAFCKECLTKKTAVPKRNNEKHKVCDPCYNILTGKVKPNENAAKYSPPEAYKKRIAALSNPEAKQPKKTLPGGGQVGVPSKYRGLSKEDAAIAQRLDKLRDDQPAAAAVPSVKEMQQRLDKLKGEQPPAPSEQEMSDRLARLKGENPSQVNKPFVHKPDQRSQQQQIDDLLGEIYDEVEIDSHALDAFQDVQNRLSRLKGEESPKDDSPNNLNKGDINIPPVKDFSKNILPLQGNEQSASGEAIDWGEMNQLIQQVAKEMDIDAEKAVLELQKDKEIWGRVQNLKGKRVDTNADEKTGNAAGAVAPDSEGEEEDEENEEATKKLIQQILAEKDLEDELEEDIASGNISKTKPSEASVAGKTTFEAAADVEDDADDLPWCCMCNDDATLRCKGCDGDLYCKRCYREAHDREDYADHKPTTFKAPTKKKK